MPDNELIKVEISRIIPAQKWKVVRMITRVWEFPAFVPTVKEAQVIGKTRNRMITRWHIQVDNIPIKWTEEDTIDADKSTISFRSIEGDLEEFRGEWHFKDHPSGCQVLVTVYLKIGIPVIKDFAQNYVTRVVSRNFEAILEALEHRLVSLKYASHKTGVKRIAGFGLIGHFYNYRHFENYVKGQHPDLKMPSPEFVSRLFHVTPSFKACDSIHFRSKTGQETKGCFILATFFPDMIDKDVWAVYSKVVKACKIAEKHGVGIVCLGGFSSIPAYRIDHEVTSELDIPVTTGKTYTSALIIDSVLRAARLLGVDLSKATLTVVGGAGVVGSACSRVFAGNVRKLIIGGTPKSNLNAIASELKKQRRAQIECCQDSRAAVQDADIVICAAGVPASIIDLSWFRPGTIVCDAGFPKNVSYFSAPREDVLLFDGGLVFSPCPLQIPIDFGMPSPEVTFGAFAEAIILDLEGRYENYSSGRGKITPEMIEEMRGMAARHGFEAAELSWAKKPIPVERFETVKAAIRKNVEAG
jgi:fatty aldehyde-generating acyl-ACP reductase